MVRPTSPSSWRSARSPRLTTPTGLPLASQISTRETLRSFISSDALERSSSGRMLITSLVIAWSTWTPSSFPPLASRRTTMSRSVMVPTAFPESSTTGRKPMSSSAILRATSWMLAFRLTVVTLPLMKSCTRMDVSLAEGPRARCACAARASPAGEALLVRRDDARAHRAADDQRLLQRLRRRVRQLGARRDHLARLEADLAAGLADGDQLALDFDEVAGVQRCEELHRFVGAEEALVAVEPHQEFGRDVAEEPQHPGAVHQPAPVVRLVGGEPHPMRGLHPDHGLVVAPWMIASCVPCAVGCGGGLRPCRSSIR